MPSTGAVCHRASRADPLGTDGALALVMLDRFADNADVIFGHNLIDLDLPHLHAANPGLRPLRLPR